MLLRLGSVPNLIVSSPRAARSILRTHDHARKLVTSHLFTVEQEVSLVMATIRDVAAKGNAAVWT
nr:unnamed protein product [Digitaria exilis]